ERASATPIAPAPVTMASKAASVPSPPAAFDLDLRDLQRWFANRVIDGDRALERSAIDEVLTPGPALGPAERLHVYQYGYRARLVECLADDYPVLEQTLGESAFEALCNAYIEAHPSRGP